jgi:hypothetical protein
MANTGGISTSGASRIKMHTARWPATGLKAALFLASATITPATTVYTTTGELTGGSYVAGGIAVNSSQAVQISGNTTYVTPAASLAFPSLTSPGAFDCVKIYDTGDSNAVVSVHTFGNQNVTGAPFTLTMPVNDASTGLFRINWS